MLIKARTDTNSWRLFDAADDVQFETGPLWVPAFDHDFWQDDDFPIKRLQDETGQLCGVLIYHDENAPHIDSSDDVARAAYNWVSFYRDGEPVVVISQREIYICDDAGNTIEALR